jgi:hypothetical protein
VSHIYNIVFQKEKEREDEIVDFIESVLHERPKGGNFESFVRDAVILSK